MNCSAALKTKASHQSNGIFHSVKEKKECDMCLYIYQ